MFVLAFATFVAATPCAYEDTTNCYWNAAARGNKIGSSFVSIQLIPSTAWAFYLPKRFR